MPHVPGTLAGALANILGVGEDAWQQAGTRAGMLLDAALERAWRCTPFLRRFGGLGGAPEDAVARRRLGGFLALLPPKPDVASEDPLRCAGWRWSGELAQVGWDLLAQTLAAGQCAWR
jgi:hypothetical protein